jgi:5'-nucleotidase
MHILITNDDGYAARGIDVLTQELARVADVSVVAPERNKSGASNSLTLMRPLRVKCLQPDRYFVDGTPTDCVHLALSGLLEAQPDMVVSGINAGPNLGDDVLYSGTVAAAMEGRFLGLPAIAVSLAGSPATHFETAARITRLLIERLMQHPLPDDTLLNVNVPDLPYEDIVALRATRLGFRHKAEPMIRQLDPYGRPLYWVGPPGAVQDAGEGTDFHALELGIASVTPMQIDLTRHRGIEPLQQWLGAL